MARIELKYSVVRMKDGLSGTAAINEPTTAPVATDATFDVESIVLNTTVTDLIPVGARFTIAGETDATQVHIVTARTPADDDSNGTTNIEFTPALGAGTYVDEGVLTFMSQQLEIKIGDGNITYTENKNYDYELDRGLLDTVREGDQAPMDVNIDFVYEYITTGTSESVTPMDAVKNIGGAAEWVSASADLCEPYCIDIEVEYTPPCGGAEKEITVFPDFRADSKEVDFGEAQVSVTGRCNALEPTVTRVTQ
jgi:hypothetical protein